MCVHIIDSKQLTVSLSVSIDLDGFLRDHVVKINPKKATKMIEAMSRNNDIIVAPT